jgi:hypothetical protein
MNYRDGFQLKGLRSAPITSTRDIQKHILDTMQGVVQAVDLRQGLLQHSHSEPVLLQIDHSWAGLQVAGCILPGHKQAGQLKHIQLPEQHYSLTVGTHFHSWDQLELPGNHSSHLFELLGHNRLVGLADTVHNHLAGDNLVHSVHMMELVVAHPAVDSPVEHTHPVQLQCHKIDHKQEVAEMVAHKMQEAPGKFHLQPVHLLVAIVSESGLTSLMILHDFLSRRLTSLQD